MAAAPLHHPTGTGAGTAEYPWSREVVYQLKIRYRDGTTHFVFEPIEFLARLAALVPRPRGNLVRYHGHPRPQRQTSQCGGAEPVAAE